MLTRPVRGPAVGDLGLALPPGTMPGRRGGRPLKRWRWVGVFTPEIELCVAEAYVGPAPRRWWAVALPGGELHERTTVGRGGVVVGETRVEVSARGARIELSLDESPAIEVVSPTRRGDYAWTAKRACVGVHGRVVIGDRERRIDGPFGFVDHSAGYHDRHTRWRWSAGIGVAADGRRVAWNLVDGIHDDPRASERTLWVDGEAQEIGAVDFAPGLQGIAFTGGDALDFSAWSVREERTNVVVVRSRYRQPFGSFSGRLPGGIVLANGFGVMEEHDVRW
jgi:hypothetical protein